MDRLDLVLYIAVSIVIILLTILGGYVTTTDPKHRKTFVILGTINFILYAAIGTKSYFSAQELKETARNAQGEARQSQKLLQDTQNSNTEQLKKIITKLEEIAGQPVPKQKGAAVALKQEIQGPRFLTDAQQQVLWQTLYPVRGSVVRIITTGVSAETQLFSSQINRAFQLGGWNVQSLIAGSGVSVEVGTGGAATSVARNLSLYEPKKSHAVEVAEQAFQNAQVPYARIEGEPTYSGPASWTASLSQPDPYIVIGEQH